MTGTVNPDLSIVIPVYNVKTYLMQCIESIICQKENNNIEIILVDDGSTDESDKICDEYSKNYSFIKVVHQTNKGLSGARNTGISHSSGNYISFLDSDDYYRPDAIRLFYNQLSHDVDIIIGSFMTFKDGTDLLEPHEQLIGINTQICDGREALERILNICPTYGWYAWKYFVKRKLLIDHSLWFKEGIYFEDAQWTPRLFLEAHSVSFFDKPFYCYRICRKDSIMNSIGGDSCNKKFLSQMEVLDDNIKLLKNHEITWKLKEKLLQNFSGIYTSLFFGQFCSEVSNINRRKIKNNAFLISYIIRQNELMLKTIYNLFGYDVLYILYNSKYKGKSYLKKIMSAKKRGKNA